MDTRQTRPDRRNRSIVTRGLALAGAVALLGAACASDEPESAPEPVPAESDASTSVTDAAGTDNDDDTDAVAAEEVNETTGTDETTASDEGAATDEGAGTEEMTDSAAAGDIAITATIDFEDSTGTWETTSGADVLGCEGGSFTEGGFAAGAERTYTCDDGSRTGTVVVRFAPEPVDADAMEFVSEWTVHAATGDFAGLSGAGDFNAVMNDDRSAADETWTGSIEFGDPSDDVGGDAADTEAAASGEVVLDEAFLVAMLERLGVPDDADGTVTVAVIDAAGDSITAADGNSPDGSLPGPADPVRVGSITKVFTSLATLSLVDDGSIGLDDPVADHVSGVDVPEEVTIRDLLQHTSGIPNYTDVDGFFDLVFEDDLRVWTPEESVGLVDMTATNAADGDAEFSYSNTNFVILGILIEEVTGQGAHEVIRERVTDVVDMPSTYLAGAEEGPAPFPAFSAPSGEDLAPIEFDYTSIATSAWAAGAMVSNGDDLHRLFTALFDGQIVSDEQLAAMLANDEYGLGIEWYDGADTLVGHGGGIPGYGTLVFHDPQSGQTAYWSSTSDELMWGPIVEDVAQAMVPSLASDDES